MHELPGIEFQSAVHATSAADRVAVQHYVSCEHHDASFHYGHLPAYKHISVQNSALCLPRPLEGECCLSFQFA